MIKNQIQKIAEIRQQGDSKLLLIKIPLKRKTKTPKRLVLIPGLGDSPLSWSLALTPVFPFLRLKFDEIVILDFPGYQGFLMREKMFHNFEDMRKQVFDTLDTIHPDTLIGHSLGGWLAAEYATLCGEKKRPKHSSATRKYKGPNELILFAPSGVLRKGEELLWKNRFVRALEGEAVAFSKMMFKKQPIWFKAFDSQISKFFKRPELNEFVHSIDFKHLLQSRVSNITGKVTLIWGDHDQINFSHWLKEWQVYLPEANAYYLRSTGHMPHLEKPVLVTSLLIKTIFSESALLSKLPQALQRLQPRFWELVEAQVLEVSP